MAYCVEDSGAKVAIADDERLVRLLPVLPALRKAGLSTLITVRAQHLPQFAKADSLEEVLRRHQSSTVLPDVVIDADDDATIFYTSGTTGKPKGALGTQRNFVTNLFNLQVAPMRAALRRGEEIPAPDPNAPQKGFLLSVPLTTAGGMKLVIMHKWDAGEALRLIEKEKITTAGGVPSMVWQMVEHPDWAKRDLSSLEGFSFGGAPAAPELVRAVRGRLPLGSASNGYGLTETSSADYVRKPDSIGVPVPVNQVKIVNDAGKEVARGQIGEIWIKGPNIIKAYWNKPEATASTITADGWLKSGDVGIMDDEGFIYIKDRAKDMLIRGGENIYCVEVEDALFSHPSVMDAAVVSIPHRILGEEVAAAVQIKPQYVGKVGEEDLRRHCRKRWVGRGWYAGE
ncbi:hypothetical protein HDU93_000471 [Gonapodya sp. JEL0774]|nr:hypothetical protein HDU93_000471 [Gonapodya sp. JEL0774]